MPRGRQRHGPNPATSATREGNRMTTSGPSAGLPLALVAGEDEGSAGRIEELLSANGFEALRAGAWECVGRSTDSGELILKLNAFMRAKLDADRSRAEGLIDPATGLYNRQGMARRVQELGSFAFREHGSLACVVLALDLEPDAAAAGDTAAAAILKSVQALKSNGRLSDVLGRLGPTEFAVIAPSTDPAGALRLAERMVRAIRESSTAGGQSLPVRQVRVGYEAVSNVGYAPIQPVDLLVRASAALRRGTAEGGRSWIRR